MKLIFVYICLAFAVARPTDSEIILEMYDGAFEEINISPCHDTFDCVNQISELWV